MNGCGQTYDHINLQKESYYTHLFTNLFKRKNAQYLHYNTLLFKFRQVSINMDFFQRKNIIQVTLDYALHEYATENFKEQTSFFDNLFHFSKNGPGARNSVLVEL